MLPPFSDSKFISFTIVKIQMAIRFKIDLKNPPSTYLPTYLLLYISIFMTLCKMALPCQIFLQTVLQLPWKMTIEIPTFST